MVWIVLFSVSAGINLLLILALGRAEHHYNRMAKVYVAQGKLLSTLLPLSKQKEATDSFQMQIGCLNKALDDYAFHEGLSGE